MRIEALDHVNIRTSDVLGTSRFFADVLSMNIRPSPGSDDLARAAWLCDAEGRAIIHLGDADIGYSWEEGAVVAAPGSGRIHHVALRCVGYDQMTARLEAQQRAFHTNSVPAANLRQIFLEDPNGITLELNFFE